MFRFFLLLLFSTSVFSQSYPEKPIRLIVGFPPGGSSDTVARLVAQHLSPQLGQPVVVENKPGAGGLIGSELVAKSAPDGHTLLLATAANATSAAMMKQLPFDPLDGFAWITTLTTYPFVIAAAAGSKFSSLRDVMVEAKKAPATVSYSTAGVGTSHHLLGEWFGAEAGVELLHVPFKGGASPVTEVMSGRVDVMFETMTLVLPHIRSGKLRALAVTSPQPVEFLPGVPAAAQTLPGFVFQSWLGVAAAAGTPKPVVDSLNGQIRKVLSKPEVQERLASLGGSAAPVTPAEMRAQVRTEIERWRRLVESRNIERN
jgi:tripartite-type tricarboxylate transporter receptor subunit TctC